jgi:hypothetical protein
LLLPWLWPGYRERAGKFVPFQLIVCGFALSPKLHAVKGTPGTPSQLLQRDASYFLCPCYELLGEQLVITCSSLGRIGHVMERTEALGLDHPGLKPASVTV